MREKILKKINFRLFWWSRKSWIMEFSSDDVNQFRHRNPKKAQFANVGVEAIQWNFIFIHNPSWGHFMSWKTNNHRLHHDLIIYQINLNYRDSKIVNYYIVLYQWLIIPEFDLISNFQVMSEMMDQRNRLNRSQSTRQNQNKPALPVRSTRKNC